MLTIHIATIFPNYFDGPFDDTIINRAKKKCLINIVIHNLRDYTKDKHRAVDDSPFGGGAGMILKVEPIYNFLFQLNTHPNNTAPNSKIILTSPKGRLFDQQVATEYSKLENIVFICGRYEGVDHRVSKYLIDEEVSVGNFILSGGEPAVISIVDAITRLLPGSLGNPESLKDESFNNLINNSPNSKGLEYEYPQYTRPAIFKTKKGKSWSVPKVLQNGNHAEIEKWRRERIIKVEK